MTEISKGRYWDEGVKIVSGCTRCSDGCKNCWSLAMENRFAKRDKLGLPLPSANKIIIHPERLSRFNTRKPKVFAIWNDLFHEDVPFEFILATLIHAVGRTDNKYLILTKRPQRMVEFFKWMDTEAELTVEIRDCFYFGLTVCNQQEADEKIPIFLQVPGKKFLSIEPCLSHIDLTKWLIPDKLLEKSGGENYEREREGIFNTGGIGLVQCEHRKRDYNEDGQDVRQQDREQISRPDVGKSSQSGKVDLKKSLKNMVLNGRETDGCIFTQDNLDDSQQCDNTRRAGNQSQGREPQKQSIGELRGSNETREHTSCRKSVEGDGEEKPDRRAQCLCESERGASFRNKKAVQNENNAPTSNSKTFRDTAGDSKQHSSKKNMETSSIISLVILGGEAGGGARPLHPDWVRFIRDQCAAAGVPFFFKQWGEWGITGISDIPEDSSYFGEWTTISSTDRKSVGKKSYYACNGEIVKEGALIGWKKAYHLERIGRNKAGRELDGITHDDLPWVKEDKC